MMKFSIGRILVATTLLPFVMVGACNNSNSSGGVAKDAERDSTAKVAESHNEAKFDKVGEKDAKYVVDAYSAGLFEINAADTAKTYATTKEAKSLADMLAAGHISLNGQLKDLASKKQITLPTELSSDQNGKIDKLKNSKRVDFDKNYASAMVDGHKDAIKLFEKASTECTDNDIKNWFSSALPELRKHLDMAMNSEDALKKMKR